jgi:uncharacterized protein (TIGR03083 family)
MGHGNSLPFMLTTQAYLDSIQRDAEGFAAAVEGNWTAAVDKCPGWTVSDLLWHLRAVHYFWTTIVADRLTDPEGVVEIERPASDEALLDDFREGAKRLVETLGAADQNEPVWTWARQKDVAFITRHQVGEAAVHRWDAERAAGREHEIPAEVASDAVDEFLQLSAVNRQEGAPAIDSPVCLVATDSGESWLVGEDSHQALWAVRNPEDITGHAATWRASASDLLLALFRRIDPRGEIEGNALLVDRLIAHTDLS